MHNFVLLITLVLAGIGITVMIVWPEHGPTAFLRDSCLRKMLPAFAEPVLDCYICLSFWVGLSLSPLWWYMSHEWWIWTACLMLPAVFWIILRPISIQPSDEENPDETIPD